jgi:hypothetical protein
MAKILRNIQPLFTRLREAVSVLAGANYPQHEAAVDRAIDELAVAVTDLEEAHRELKTPRGPKAVPIVVPVMLLLNVPPGSSAKDIDQMVDNLQAEMESWLVENGNDISENWMNNKNGSPLWKHALTCITGVHAAGMMEIVTP